MAKDFNVEVDITPIVIIVARFLLFFRELSRSFNGIYNQAWEKTKVTVPRRIQAFTNGIFIPVILPIGFLYPLFSSVKYTGLYDILIGLFLISAVIAILLAFLALILQLPFITVHVIKFIFVFCFEFIRKTITLFWKLVLGL